MAVKTVARAPFNDALELAEALRKLTATFDSPVMYVSDTDGNTLDRLSIRETTLSDGSTVYDVVLS